MQTETMKHSRWQSTVKRLQHTVEERKKARKRMEETEEDNIDTFVFRGMRREAPDADEVRHNSTKDAHFTDSCS